VQAVGLRVSYHRSQHSCVRSPLQPPRHIQGQTYVGVEGASWSQDIRSAFTAKKSLARRSGGKGADEKGWNFDPEDKALEAPIVGLDDSCAEEILPLASGSDK